MSWAGRATILTPAQGVDAFDFDAQGVGGAGQDASQSGLGCAADIPARSILGGGAVLQEG